MRTPEGFKTLGSVILLTLGNAAIVTSQDGKQC